MMRFAITLVALLVLMISAGSAGAQGISIITPASGGNIPAAPTQFTMAGEATITVPGQLLYQVELKFYKWDYTNYVWVHYDTKLANTITDLGGSPTKTYSWQCTSCQSQGAVGAQVKVEVRSHYWVWNGMNWIQGYWTSPAVGTYTIV